MKKGEDGKIIKNVLFTLKPKKSKDPAPGQYETDNSIRKTQWPSHIFAFHKEKNQTYIGRIGEIINKYFIFRQNSKVQDRCSRDRQVQRLGKKFQFVK